MPIVMDDDFINRIGLLLDGYATELKTLRVAHDPLFTNLVVEAGADGFPAGTNLETSVKAAGTALENRLASLETNLANQAALLRRLLAESDTIESLNTESAEWIRPHLDPDFIGQS